MNTVQAFREFVVCWKKERSRERLCSDCSRRINSYLSTWKQTRKCMLSIVTQGIFFFLVKRINKLGSGNDFEVFFQRLGIASGRARYSKNWVSLHLSNCISLAIAWIITVNEPFTVVAFWNSSVYCVSVESQFLTRTLYATMLQILNKQDLSTWCQSDKRRGILFRVSGCTQNYLWFRKGSLAYDAFQMNLMAYEALNSAVIHVLWRI